MEDMRHIDSGSIAREPSATVHLVLDDFGVLGRSWRENDEMRADADDIIGNILRGDYTDPAQVIAFNAAEGWSRDVSAQIARALIERTRRGRMPEHVRRFVERHVVCLAY
jgi:hypothetical protein